MHELAPDDLHSAPKDIRLRRCEIMSAWTSGGVHVLLLLQVLLWTHVLSIHDFVEPQERWEYRSAKVIRSPTRSPISP